ncbi:MAG: hypothetical protein NTV32_00640 [Gammaproteobacteria bacterium]|nr:hypothetical protein [Gammaproteobacteria bacterium]
MFNFMRQSVSSATLIRCLDVMITGVSSGVTAFKLMEAPGLQAEAQIFGISTGLTLAALTAGESLIGWVGQKVSGRFVAPFIQKSAKHLTSMAIKIVLIDALFQLCKLAQGGYDSAADFVADTRDFLQVLVAAHAAVSSVAFLQDGYDIPLKFACPMLAELGLVQGVGKIIKIEAATNAFAGAIFAAMSGKLALQGGKAMYAHAATFLRAREGEVDRPLLPFAPAV